jgi:hypothetical protein
MKLVLKALMVLTDFMEKLNTPTPDDSGQQPEVPSVPPSVRRMPDRKTLAAWGRRNLERQGIEQPVIEPAPLVNQTEFEVQEMPGENGPQRKVVLRSIETGEIIAEQG